MAVKDKSSITCSADETRVLVPQALQAELDLLVADAALLGRGRCFIRPSGTEDIVRVYAEALTQELADRLAEKCIEVVLKFQ